MTEHPAPPAGHEVHRSATAHGFIASCPCGWRVMMWGRDQRDRAARSHLTAARKAASEHVSNRREIRKGITDLGPSAEGR